MDVVTLALLEDEISEVAPELIAEATDDWLEENVAQETGYVLDSTLTMSNAAAPADKVGELKTAFNGVTEAGKNMLYSEGVWSDYSASHAFSGNDLIITATSSNTYRMCAVSFDVRNINSIVVSWASKTSTSEGSSPASIRWGETTSLDDVTQTWKAYLSTSPTVLDVSEMSYIKIGLYVAQGESAKDDYATFTKLQIEKGSVATEFSSDTRNAVDEVARNEIAEIKNIADETQEPYNLLFVSSWNEPSATVAINGKTLTLTAKSSGTYRNAYNDIDVSGINKITVSCESMPAGDHLRIGYVDGGTVTWIKYTRGETVDVSNYNTIRIGLYCTISTSVDQGFSINYEGLMVVVGEKILPPYNKPISSIDAQSRGYIEKLMMPSGNIGYFGERINLTLNNIFNANYEVWKDFKSSEISGLADYELWRGQSIEIFNNYLFIFLASSEKCVVMNFTTKEIIGSFTISGSGHANSAQFTDMYYDEDDTYPILLISLCSNQLGTDYHNDGCAFYRVQYEDNAFVFTLLSKCFLNAETYGSTWAIDNVTKTLYSLYYLNGTYTVRENNPTYIAVFKCPTKATIIAGTDTTFTESDAETIFQTDHLVMQGCFGKNGNLYVANSDYIFGYGHSLWVYNIFEKRLLSIMSYNDHREAEGLCFFNGNIYVQQRDGSDTESVNPIIITKYSFS